MSPKTLVTRAISSVVAARLSAKRDALSLAACYELGLPLAFVREQLEYAGSCLRTLAHRDVPESDERTSVAFLFPSNTDGAMPTYLLTLAQSMGLRVHAKISQRTPAIQHVLEELFDGEEQIEFYSGTGKTFLDAMFADPNVTFIQVFGSDTWIHQYKEQAQSSGKTVAFDGPGKDPIVVLKGADVDRAVRGSVASGLFAGGAACMSAERFIVHESLKERYVEGLVKALSAVTPISPDNPAATLGYLYSESAARRLLQQVDEARHAGAQFLLEGPIHPVNFAGKTFYACAPTVLTNLPRNSRLLSEESFGPVFPVQTFGIVDEAIALVEESAYGLTATVYGPEKEASEMAKQFRFSHGIVYTNAVMTEAFKPEYWGSGGYKNSGWVWETLPDTGFQTRAGFRVLSEELKQVLRRLGLGVPT